MDGWRPPFRSGAMRARPWVHRPFGLDAPRLSQVWSLFPIRDTTYVPMASACVIVDAIEYLGGALTDAQAKQINPFSLYTTHRLRTGTYRQIWPFSMGEICETLDELIREDCMPNPVYLDADIIREIPGSQVIYPYRINLGWEELPRQVDAVKAALLAGSVVGVGLPTSVQWQMPMVFETGCIPPLGIREIVTGGVAVTVVGWNDADASFTVRMHRGHKWGLGGYGYLPYSYIEVCNAVIEILQFSRVPNTGVLTHG